MKNLYKKQSGLSLIEIMVALVISLFLLGGIIQVYLGNKTAYRFSDASARVQENGRFALEIIATDIRMAGSWGCYSLADDENGDGNLSDDNPNLYNQLNFTAGAAFDFVDQPAVTATNTAGNWTTTDTLTIRGAQPGQTTLTATLPGTSPIEGDVVVSAANSFAANDIAVLTNCFAANIFQITAITPDGTTLSHGAGAGTPGNATNSFTSTTLADDFVANSAALFRLQEITYSIDDSESGSGEPALFRNRNGTTVELLEGIENFQILLGIDTDGDGAANQYLESDSAVAVANPQNVTAVRLWLVVRSERDFILDATQVYTINGNDVDPGDRRFRQVFSTTIALRNKAG
ncbi:MAG: hypothetical protein GY820_17585 [Gammaproteobacteria bacterium]|nr:hypothetical protein [Gammaproteobacteria bacterium]